MVVSLATTGRWSAPPPLTAPFLQVASTMSQWNQVQGVDAGGALRGLPDRYHHPAPHFVLTQILTSLITTGGSVD